MRKGGFLVYEASPPMSIIGENIKVLRKAVGYSSVYKFATAVGLPEKRVDQWERGNAKPKVDDTIIVAKFFGIDLELLREKSLSQSEAEKIAAKLQSSNPNSTLGGSGAPLLSANGKGNHITKSKIGVRPSTNTRAGEGLDMEGVINLSLTELLQLQREGVQDDEMRVLISKLVYYQEKIKSIEEKYQDRIKSLEENNQLLKDNLQDLRKKK